MAARLSATDPNTGVAYTSAALGKDCIQSDINKRFILTAITPSWQAVGENIGEIKAYAGALAPTGYLLCQGQSLLRASYAELFTILGTTFGSVDSTHFTLPDLQGRAPIGAGQGSGLSLRSRGDILGIETTNNNISLTVGETPALQSTANDNMQPSLCLNFIIFAAVSDS